MEKKKERQSVFPLGPARGRHDLGKIFRSKDPGSPTYLEDLKASLRLYLLSPMPLYHASGMNLNQIQPGQSIAFDPKLSSQVSGNVILVKKDPSRVSFHIDYDGGGRDSLYAVQRQEGLEIFRANGKESKPGGLEIIVLLKKWQDGQDPVSLREKMVGDSAFLRESLINALPMQPKEVVEAALSLCLLADSPHAFYGRLAEFLPKLTAGYQTGSVHPRNTSAAERKSFSDRLDSAEAHDRYLRAAVFVLLKEANTLQAMGVPGRDIAGILEQKMAKKRKVLENEIYRWARDPYLCVERGFGVEVETIALARKALNPSLGFEKIITNIETELSRWLDSRASESKRGQKLVPSKREGYSLVDTKYSQMLNDAVMAAIIIPEGAYGLPGKESIEKGEAFSAN